VLTPFIAWLWIGQRPGRAVWIAVLLSFAGTWLLGGGTLQGFNRGDGYVAACAVFWALQMTIVGHAARYGRPVAFTTIQFIVVAVLGLVAALATETTSWTALAAAAPSIAYVGVLSSALTFTLLAVSLKHTSTAEATIIVPNGDRGNRRRGDARRVAVAAGDVGSRTDPGSGDPGPAGGPVRKERRAAPA
jgi:drug/metabolite transporter (DMT)-like permease